MLTPSFGLTATERVLPKLALDFTTASLDSRITFTRTTGASNPATYTNSSGVITAATNDQPRFDYDPVSLVCKGLIIEENRTNNLLYSGTFDAAWWTPSACALSTSGTAPDGNSSIKIVADGTTGVHRLANTAFTVAASSTVTATIYAKAGEHNYLAFGISTSGAEYATYSFNLSVGTVGQVISNLYTNVSAKIAPAGNSWYRCSVTATTSGSTSCVVLIGSSPNATWANASRGFPSFTGNSVNGIYIWGAQHEAGAFATSYIPTTTTALTRNADVATMTGTNFSNWYNATQGTFRVDARTPASGTRPLISADDNTSGNSIVMSTVGTAPKLIVTQSSAEQANVSAGTITANTAMFAYASYASNYFGIARPSARQVDTSGTVPTVDRLRIGADQAGNYANGQIQAIQFWP